MALERTNLWKLIEDLPTDAYIIGDAAYCVSEKMIVPFTGSQRRNPNKDAFNFYISQLRIRVEMSFGLMTNKWRILRAPLQMSLIKSSEVLDTCARLHNYVIKFDEPPDRLMDLPAMPQAELGWGYLPTVEPLVPIVGTSQMRDILLGRVRHLGLRRPAANLQRHRYELHEINLM